MSLTHTCASLEKTGYFTRVTQAALSVTVTVTCSVDFFLFFGPVINSYALRNLAQVANTQVPWWSRKIPDHSCDGAPQWEILSAPAGSCPAFMAMLQLDQTHASMSSTAKLSRSPLGNLTHPELTAINTAKLLSPSRRLTADFCRWSAAGPQTWSRHSQACNKQVRVLDTVSLS